MQRLTLTIPVGTFLPGDRFAVFANADAVGRRVAAVDYTRPITGPTPVAFWPLAPSGPGFLEDGLAEGDFQGVPGEEPADREVVTPPLYHGWYAFAVITYDSLGNASDGPPATVLAFVTSGPRQPRRFRHASSEGGRPVFRFEAPPQMS